MWGSYVRLLGLSAELWVSRRFACFTGICEVALVGLEPCGWGEMAGLLHLQVAAAQTGDLSYSSHHMTEICFWTPRPQPKLDTATFVQGQTWCFRIGQFRKALNTDTWHQSQMDRTPAARAFFHIEDLDGAILLGGSGVCLHKC